MQVTETLENMFDAVADEFNEVVEEIVDKVHFSKANECFMLVFNRHLLLGEFRNSTAFTNSREIDVIGVLLGADNETRIQVANDALAKMQEQGAKFTHKRLRVLSDGIRSIVKCEEGVDPLKNFVTQYYSPEEYEKHYQPRKSRKIIGIELQKN